MTAYMVGLRLIAANSDELIERIESWEKNDQEGIVSITSQPEFVEVPDHLQAPPQARGSTPQGPIPPSAVG